MYVYVCVVSMCIYRYVRIYFKEIIIHMLNMYIFYAQSVLFIISNIKFFLCLFKDFSHYFYIANREITPELKAYQRFSSHF